MISGSLSIPLVLPTGWAVSRMQPIHGTLVIVSPGAGVSPIPPTSLVSYSIPPGMRYYVLGFVAKEVNYAEYSQCGAYLTWNRTQAVEGYATRRTDGVEVPVYRDFGMGVLEVVAANISLMAGFGEGIEAEIRASIYGLLLRPDRKGR